MFQLQTRLVSKFGLACLPNALASCDSGTVRVAINCASALLLHYRTALAVGEFGS